jgi:hypothetical protein
VLQERSHRGEQIGGQVGLQQIATRAGREDVADHLLRVVNCQHEHLGVGASRGDPLRRFETVQFGHRHVEDRQIGIELCGQRDRLASGRGFSAHFVPSRFEHSPQAFADHLVVVGDQDAATHVASRVRGRSPHPNRRPGAGNSRVSSRSTLTSATTAGRGAVGPCSSRRSAGGESSPDSCTPSRMAELRSRTTVPSNPSAAAAPVRTRSERTTGVCVGYPAAGREAKSRGKVERRAWIAGSGAAADDLTG